MLDELLGRAELKDRIETLEDEAERLESQLEAEKRRRSEAVSERQAAEERVNRLEDRIADLEGKLERTEDEGELDYRGVQELRGDRLDQILARLDSVETGPEGALTAVVADDGDVPSDAASLLGDRVSLVHRAAPCTLVVDDAGLVCAALDPPVPADAGATWSDGFALDHARFRPTGEFTFALVRADLCAIGEYDGRERTSFRGFESDVKSTHSKGGFSQSRFERRRDEQIATHLDRCREALADRDAERLYLVGDRHALDELDVDAVATATTDASGAPEPALGTAFHDFWTTTLYRV